MWHLSGFQPGEMVDLAVELETKGGSLYRELADKALDQQVKNLLLFLADEEIKHRDTFAQIGRDFKPVNAAETYPGEYLDYLASTVDNHMFNDDEKMAKVAGGTASGREIIELALSFEKDSILFFSGFRNFLPERQKGIIDDLVMEEQIHIIKLNRLKKEVRD